MADISGIESFFGVPEGSTPSGRELIANAAKAAAEVKAKTKDLVQRDKEIALVEDLSPKELVTLGITLEMLEKDKDMVRNEALEVYGIAKSLLVRFKDDVETLVDVNDRMWASGAKLIDSVTGSLDKLTNMVMKFKQEAQMEAMMKPTEQEENKNERNMGTGDWISFIEETQDRKP